MIPPAIPAGFEEKLRAYDQRLRVTWDYERNLWRLEERGMRTGQWRYVFYWADQGEGGKWSFRPLPSSPDPLLRELAKLDYERLGVLNERDWRKLQFGTENRRLQELRNRKKEESDHLRQAAKARYPHYMAGRRTVALDRTAIPKGA